MLALFVAIQLIAPSTPMTTLRTFERAFAAYDMRTLASLVEDGAYSEALGRLERMMKASGAPKPLRLGQIVPDVRDDTALVRVHYHFFQSPFQETFAMQRIDGRWVFSPQPRGAVPNEGRVMTGFLRALRDPEAMETFVGGVERIIREGPRRP